MSTEEQANVSDDEITEDRDQQEQSGRLTTDRDDSSSEPPAEDDADGTEDTPDDADDTLDGDTDDADTFPRDYVEKIRGRSAEYRTRARSAEGRVTELEGALFRERVAALGVLADPSDLPFNAETLDDADALRDAVADLVRNRPHLRRRGVTGPGTGSRETHDNTEPVSLLGIMRGGA